jgi:hypothetical protein
MPLLLLFQWFSRSRSFGALCLAAAAVSLLPGCASVTGGNAQKIYVQAQSSPGVALDAADCTLSNDKGSWNLKAPNDTTIIRSNKAIDVKCTAPGYKQGALSVDSATRAAMFGNIILGGVVGAVIDHSSGAAYEYPGNVTVVMGQSGSIRMESSRAEGAVGVVPRLQPPASGYAELNDVSKVPVGAVKGRNAYERFLGSKAPRAFVVSADHFAFYANGFKPRGATQASDPAERALQFCRDGGHVGCQLYAVDDKVVYVQPDAATLAKLPNPSEPVKSAYQTPPASHYAALTDATAVPVRDAGQGRYLHFLTLPKPRAFVVYEDGSWYMSWNSPKAMANALNSCERAGKPCWLYAVDDEVVWQTHVGQRIGKVAQLVPVQAP